ncbi:hypothetical protein [Hyphomicrobium sp.]|uniref:DUF7380 domain-containing protein n=1 Tax=Hyphomicrobium sp. TaxID=82 RepID=UPI000FA7E888|nr:hypothetical protein [Hyphomicrobium sp.]RUP00630.1 MAG: hypothetical protein EKK30_00810 [Hyphomicrobium sp.]
MSEPEEQTEPDQPPEGEKRSSVFEHVTAEDFAIGCEAPIANSRKVDVLSLGELYESASRRANSDGDVRASRVYGLVASVVKIHFKPNDKAEPYGPMFVANGRRSLIPSDLRGAQSEVFAAVAPRILNPGLRARLADIAWLNNRKHVAMAQLAIGSYCEAVQDVTRGQAELFFDDAKATSHNGAEMLRRACQIANMTRWKEPEASTLRSLVSSLSESAFGDRDARGFLNIGELDADYKIGDVKEMAERAETLAQSTELDPYIARNVWELAARAHRQSGREADSNRCLISAAECYVRMAEAAGLKGMSASSWLMDAIKALRGIPRTKERRAALEAKLREAQASIADEMGSLSTQIDIGDLVDHARKVVSHLTLAQALFEFANLERSPASEKLREEAIKLSTESPLSSIIPMSIHDDDGKVVAKSPGLGGGDEDEYALRHLIARGEQFRRQIATSGMIEPARRTIMAEHPLEDRDLLPLAELSPFVPPGYEHLFAMGFGRFFGGDYISALHILVPQIENSLRYVLRHAAIDTSSMQSDMTQENRTLSVMLSKDRAALERIFGEAITLEIENLFDFEGGPSLRHRLAHGLLSAGACYSYDSIYACWFIFRLCCLPLFRDWQLVADRLAQL